MATFAVGDLQGCLSSLTLLLAHVGFSRTRDRLWFVGDLVNRGPQSLETLRFVRGLGDRAVAILGNHDLHLVMVHGGYGRNNRDDTLSDILAAPDRDELLTWLRNRPLLHVEDDYALVHAGLLPQWPVAQAKELAQEVEFSLQAPTYPDFLAHMYGSLPDVWQDSLAGWDRLRVVVNAMTRMRFCTVDGVMDFRAKGPPEKSPPGFMPWYAVPHRASRTHTVVCGHWSALGLRMEADLLALDTGCLWGGRLTAVRLEDRKVFQIDCPQSSPPTGWD